MDQRPVYDKPIDLIIENLNALPEDQVCGHLNYIFFLIVKKFLKKKGFRYFRLNSIIGAFECCKLEIYRRLVGPYENEKEKEHGSVE